MTKITVRKELSQEERKNLDNYSDTVAHLLFHRGITNNSEAEKFINPNYDTDLHDPFLFDQMGEAVDFILDSIKENKKICVYSDYDADGVPGAVILTDFFDQIGFENYFVYIPHRNIEGFGLNKKAIEKIKEEKSDLIITIDCGIADVAEVDYINELRMKIIITDHHEPNGKDPKAFAIVNHKKENCNYPDKNLCGSGVIFKVVQALVARGKERSQIEIFDGWDKWLLDMVGLATLSDMVPLKGENRVFSKYGLTVLQKTKRAGLHKLYEKRNIDYKNLNEDDLGFMIVPNINAASRMGDAKVAFDLLKAKDSVEAGAIVDHLAKINNQRKVLVAGMVKELHKMLKDEKDIKVIGVGNPDWQPSLLGLAANKIAEEHKVPVFLWGRGLGDELKGSCRIGSSGSLIEIMNHLGHDFLEFYGGHRQAGGFVIRPEKVGHFQEKLNEVVSEMDFDDVLYEVDAKLNLDEIDLKFIKEINQLAPFGVGNEKPVFLLENVEIANIRTFGKGDAHTEVQFKKSDGGVIGAIEFYKKPEDFDIEIKEGKRVNLVVNLEINTYGGRSEARLRIVSIYPQT